MVNVGNEYKTDTMGQIFLQNILEVIDLMLCSSKSRYMKLQK